MKFHGHLWTTNICASQVSRILLAISGHCAQPCVLLERGQISAVSGAIGYGYPLHVHDRLIS